MGETTDIILVQNRPSWDKGKDLDFFLEDAWFISQRSYRPFGDSCDFSVSSGECLNGTFKEASVTSLNTYSPFIIIFIHFIITLYFRILLH
jgi:hypothetical protein